MSLEIKIAIFAAILVMDIIGGMAVIRSLQQKGKGEQAKVIFMGLVVGLIAVAVVLFGVL